MAIRAYGKSVASYDDWVTLTAYELTDDVAATDDTGYRYECTTAGTTGITEPSWPLEVDQTVADGTVVWTCKAKAASPSALSVELDTGGVGGYPYKDVWMKSDGSVVFLVEVSHTGANGTWRELDSENVNNAEELNQYVTPYRHIRVSTETVASNEIEIVAGV